MCSSKYSQAWASDELAYNTDAESKIDIFSSFAMDNKALDQLVELASDCSDIFIKGGEPFYSKEAIYFLKKLRKLESRPHIFTQTNGTVISTEIKSLIEDLNIEIGISIDGVGETYEWIRGFSYDQLISNISTFSRLSTDHKISLDFTASLFNCASLSESLKGFKVLMQENAKIGHVSLFSIARQARNSFLSLPLEFREQELESLLAYKDIGLESLEVLEKTLMQEQSGPEVQKVALHWLNFLESKRGKIPARKKDRFSQWAKGVIS
jgi:sulfatase maturation enzyme AslB (radical SAM superfamily)